MLEMVAIFNEQMERIGTASRDDVHAQGLWHETFQCWLVNPRKQTIFLQLRSACKKDYAQLFDITAAGHLLATETIEDGIREMEEELGYAQPFAQLKKVGILQSVMVTPPLLDYEFCHVFIAEVLETPAFYLQQEEVADVVEISFAAFEQLVHQAPTVVETHGLCQPMKYAITPNQLVPHPPTYYAQLLAYLTQQYER